jgi:hypothetical protein
VHGNWMRRGSRIFGVGGDGGGAVEPRCVGPFGLTAPRYRRTLGCHLRVR